MITVSNLEQTNYADTLTSLLAVLSHPAEIAAIEEGVTSRSVIFVIDEFDMFATHPRQTLLYNLFDIAQARKAPIAVLGCTTRIDVVEMLEKRVKSRFSHRYVFLSPPKNVPVFWEICKQGLCVDEDDLEAEGIDTGVEGHAEFQRYWNKNIDVSLQSNVLVIYSDISYADSVQASIIPKGAALSLLHGKVGISISNVMHLASVNSFSTVPNIRNQVGGRFSDPIRTTVQASPALCTVRS